MPTFPCIEAVLLDGRVVRIESHTVDPGRESAFGNTIAMAHPEAVLITHGLLMLRREGASYFGDEDQAPRLGHGYEYCDLSKRSRNIVWLTLRAKNSRKRHLVGLLEWRDVNPAEAVVTGLYVSKQFRDLGVATALMNEAVEQMKDDDYSVALAFVPPSNEVACDFFASRDFQLVLHAGDGEDELRVLDLKLDRLFWFSLDQGHLFQ
ncbi:MAG: GNAT family N-acetyltransferase [Candidatus Moranbacteria bacterium]|nr:GNAT family N-acetyltransferase [Candidatus Moranbacteria bacterium]